MLNGYFGYLANEILKRNKITYNDMLDILLYAAYEEERLKLDEYDNILFKNISSSLYQQGIEEISSKKSKYKGIDDDLLLSFLMIPIDGVIYSEYVKALSLTNSQEIKKLGVSYIGNGNKVNVYDDLFERTLKKQRNRLICISENGISGRLDLQCTTLGNYSYLQAGIDTNTRYVKFVSDFCENVTKMCSNMDGIIFDIKGDNKFHRWWGHDSKHLTYEEIKCFGLIQGINMPPIMQHFHWCHSTLTYQTELSTDEIRRLMKNGNIKDNQPIDSFVSSNEKNGLGASNDYTKEKHPEPILLGRIEKLNQKNIYNTLKRYEKIIKDDKIENAIVITSNGEIYQCFGNESNVWPDEDLGDKLIGAIVTHNHPIHKTNYSFSNADISLFEKYNLKLLRGIDKKYTYELNSNKKHVLEMPEDYLFNDYGYEHLMTIQYAIDKNVYYMRWKNE